MLGLGYESSDDEDAAQTIQLVAEPGPSESYTRDAMQNTGANISTSAKAPVSDVVMGDAENEEEANEPASSVPALGPSMAPHGISSTTHTESDSQSQFTATRTAIRNLTMPPISNFDIPSSPPGSPSPGSSKKFAQFLELKKKGIHFNSKLENSSALRNPALLQKLMDFAGIDHYDQYATALPEDLAVVTSYPPWAYGEELNKSQQQLLKKKDGAKTKTQRDKIDFVAGGEASRSNRAATHGSSRSTAERVIVGLDRGKVKVSPKANEKRRRDDGQPRRRSRSRSPRRKRSRSR